jgi:DNA mismatch repair ATPase MutS
MKTLKASFNELRKDDGSIVLFKMGERYEALYADAATLVGASGCKMDSLIDADGQRIKHASIDEDEISDMIRRLPANINKVVIHLDSRRN